MVRSSFKLIGILMKSETISVLRRIYSTPLIKICLVFYAVHGNIVMDICIILSGWLKTFGRNIGEQTLDFRDKSQFFKYFV